MHVAEGGVRRVQLVGGDRGRPGRARQRRSARTTRCRLPASPSARRELHRRHDHRPGRPPASRRPAGTRSTWSRTARTSGSTRAIPTYWDPEDKTKGGGPPDSWDFSMRVSGLPKCGVHVEPGDVLRSNAAYDTKLQSTYENMGIAVSLLVPEDADGKKQAPGVDPFTRAGRQLRRAATPAAWRRRRRRCARTGCSRRTGTTRRTASAAARRASGPCRRTRPLSGATSEIGIADFLYVAGRPERRRTRWACRRCRSARTCASRTSTAGRSSHTITSCKFPCLGPTGAAFPLA